ncbi:MAG TPA: hypothetical protein VLK65_03790 [Vicinamibacteria bacterium]|nr:hypothetical protein [Vicinamibacteria bacterium]
MSRSTIAAASRLGQRGYRALRVEDDHPTRDETQQKIPCLELRHIVMVVKRVVRLRDGKVRYQHGVAVVQSALEALFRRR